MKISKTKFQCETLFKRSVYVSLVFALALCCVNTAHAQTYSDLDGATLELLETAFQQEMEKLKEEVNNPQPGISIESNRTIFHYYESVSRTFNAGDVELRDAFISQVPVLQYGPVGTHELTEALFTDQLDDSVVSFEMSSTAQVKEDLLTSEFKDLLLEIEVGNNDISKVINLFEFIRNNK